MIAPVLVFNDNPVGSAGLTEKVGAGDPVVVKLALLVAMAVPLTYIGDTIV